MAPPTKPAHLRRDRRVVVKMNAPESALLEAFSDATSLDPSAAIRRALVEAWVAMYGNDTPTIRAYAEAMGDERSW